MSSLINRRDLDFLLFEYLEADTLTAFDRYADHDRATFDAVIDAAEQLAVDQFQSHAAKLDANEPHFDGERVHIIPEVKAAVDAYIDGGFLGMAFDAEDGGLQLPYTIAQACASLFSAANIGTAGYAFLTGAAANMLRIVGSDEQKQRYMRPMIEGRFFGTMCLSEPQAGSSLGDIKTRAIPQPDGSYHLVGTKMWISGGEHDLSENIVHMVLAKIDVPDTPPGTKGISLFVVPKFMVNDDGSLGARNGVRLAGLNHKMGYRGTVNTVLNFGESEDCVGYLVGTANKGLAGMFHMMNEARIGVGMGAAVLGYAGYQVALDYAKNRPQGRPAADKNPTSKPVAIIEHADIRRLLLAQKAAVEGAYGLCLYCARLVDTVDAGGDEDAIAHARLLLEILTPIAKSWPSEFCLEANKHAIQVLGGYGYTRDYPVERLYRDNRLNPIHEGTHGIQGMDLLGRKVLMQDGAAFKLLVATITETVERHAGDDTLGEFAASLREALAAAGSTTQTLVGAAMSGQLDRFLTNATIYLDMLGHVVLAWQWLEQAGVALRNRANAPDADRAFYDGKLTACRYFFRYELPKIHTQCALLKQLDDTTLTVDPAGL
ncbi:acyl-CoA dehydrogenase [uncultured Abyssibacter sp.]|uniref:acyl-CoA dehydrogenase n=1 Tax=uncultured Abyssibacter sp. TaxID=2320202 RepID=UPI0032B1A6B8